MKGFTQLEFLVALSFFLVILFGGYDAFEWQQKLTLRMENIVRPEEESNYRLLVMKAYFEDSSRLLKKDTMLQEAPCFFADLQFGQSPTATEFSVACPVSDPVPYERAGSLLRVSKTIPLEPDFTLLLAGPASDGSYVWNYGKITRIVPIGGETRIEVEVFLERPIPDSGSLCVVQLHGFRYSNGMLYWMSPAGQSSPFFALDEFESSIVSNKIQIRWRKGEMESSLWIRP